MRRTIRALHWGSAFTLLSATVMLEACASAGGVGGGAYSAPFGRRDERRIIGSYTDVRDVGVSRRYVYAASPSGISVYDRVFNTWLPPLSQEMGLTDLHITFIAGDPVEDAVWLGVPGAIIVYRPQSEQLQRTIVTGVPDVVVFDRAGGGDAYVRSSGQWTRISRVGSATPVAGPPRGVELIAPSSLNDVYGRYPGLRVGTPLLFRNQQADRPLRAFPVVTGSLSPDQPSEVWLGTAGDGLYKVDGVTMQAAPLRFGLLEQGVGALALAADGVWAAGVGQSRVRAGLTFATNDLQQWRWIDGTISVPLLGVRATAMSIRGDRAWVGTERGLVHVQLDAREQMTRWTSLDGLPDDVVLSVAAVHGGAWVGTTRGLVFVNDSTDSRNARTRGLSRARLDGMPVYALQPIGDTLWIGTAAGLVAQLPMGNVVRPASNDPALRGRVTALAWSDTVLLAAADNALFRISTNGAHAPMRMQEINPAAVGQVTRLAVDDRTVVVAGTDGVLVVQRAGGFRQLHVPRDIPGPALDVAMSRDWIWIGTPAGLVRLRRSTDGSLP